jgi:hypothetical protein
MGNREIYIIKTPEIYNMYLERNNLYDKNNKVFIDLLTENLIDVAKAMLANPEGTVDLDETFQVFKDQGIHLTDAQENEILEVFKIAGLEILKTLVTYNVHSRLFYVDNYSKQQIVLMTYDGPLHNPNRR